MSVAFPLSPRLSSLPVLDAVYPAKGYLRHLERAESTQNWDNACPDQPLRSPAECRWPRSAPGYRHRAAAPPQSAPDRRLVDATGYHRHSAGDRKGWSGHALSQFCVDSARSKCRRKTPLQQQVRAALDGVGDMVPTRQVHGVLGTMTEKNSNVVH